MIKSLWRMADLYTKVKLIIYIKCLNNNILQ